MFLILPPPPIYFTIISSHGIFVLPWWHSGGRRHRLFPQNYSEGLLVHFVFFLSLCPSPLHSVEPGAGVEYRIHSVPPRVYNPHHSTLAASTLSMHVLVNRCSSHTHTYTTRSYNASKKSDESSAAAAIARMYVPASGVFFCFPLRANTAD